MVLSVTDWTTLNGGWVTHRVDRGGRRGQPVWQVRQDAVFYKRMSLKSSEFVYTWRGQQDVRGIQDLCCLFLGRLPLHLQVYPAQEDYKACPDSCNFSVNPQRGNLITSVWPLNVRVLENLAAAQIGEWICETIWCRRLIVLWRWSKSGLSNTSG